MTPLPSANDFPSTCSEDSFEIIDHALLSDSPSFLGQPTSLEKEDQDDTLSGENNNAPNEAKSDDRREVWEAARAKAVESREKMMLALDDIDAFIETIDNIEEEEKAYDDVDEDDSKLPPPRLVRVEMDEDETKFGIRLYSFGDDDLFVQELIRGSPADRAGLAVGDSIFTVNGISTKGLKEEQVDELMLAAGKTVELLTLNEDDTYLYKDRDIPVTLSHPHIIRGAAECESFAPVPVHLTRRDASKSYGFCIRKNEESENIVSTVEAGGIAARAGLKVGMQIHGVNNAFYHYATEQSEIADAVNAYPQSVTLWVEPVAPHEFNLDFICDKISMIIYTLLFVDLFAFNTSWILCIPSLIVYLCLPSCRRIMCAKGFLDMARAVHALVHYHYASALFYAISWIIAFYYDIKKEEEEEKSNELKAKAL
ncbi:hypothetical protein PFISCL1PPCAC_8409 [Pristionchus fissidentatus]|uniref:PDZ domain-containing protein n=1 Tax=Pristionchus fissidentatus TaxID=1538716 RepID=A0AAV5VG43_9BILA|nr:hypothetical protein PFISCL1PPCAC_8409 [Pristionchus fissidentatus]